ncbi:hypothetical protein [Campylobacter pinnipediorum]|uniref:Uncharacterized protein n=1 Tax=Campylobacter pinnipediorum subsp. pinnipediorum TaxID=1660067 RepID=A0AAX0LA58_9BACT|nr:hypothetical protein [Campylobacter pinnipediorum]AQW81254.1 hypothetical protein CPIN17260_0957 [Campylobacter pinnipediorum subsp. pinnipediorum]AQW82874.1 hypothetical protein CPIN17261_0864 [Campylobacter pinnipediorum subsp. pinnipediorum]OPA77216.1 hypothetical protein BFG04_03735 [Campylobacter pinnipediorum subsp. pinnipediorum]
MKVYVASAYDTALKAGKSKRYVRELAFQAMIQAVNHFPENCSLFSPVAMTLDMQNIFNNKSRDEMMRICLDRLNGCDALFIPNLSYTLSSEEIRQEYKFATNNNKKIVFENHIFQEIFDQDLAEDYCLQDLRDSIKRQDENIKETMKKVIVLFDKINQLCEGVKS